MAQKPTCIDVPLDKKPRNLSIKCSIPTMKVELCLNNSIEIESTSNSAGGLLQGMLLKAGM